MPSNAMLVGTVAAGTVGAAVIDLRTRRVPNALTGMLAAVGAGVAAIKAPLAHNRLAYAPAIAAGAVLVALGV